MSSKPLHKPLKDIDFEQGLKNLKESEEQMPNFSKMINLNNMPTFQKQFSEKHIYCAPSGITKKFSHI